MSLSAHFTEKVRRNLEDFFAWRSIDAKMFDDGREDSLLFKVSDKIARWLHRDKDDYQAEQAELKAEALRALAVSAHLSDPKEIRNAIEQDGVVQNIDEAIHYMNAHRTELLEDPYLRFLSTKFSEDMHPV